MWWVLPTDYILQEATERVGVSERDFVMLKGGRMV